MLMWHEYGRWHGLIVNWLGQQVEIPLYAVTKPLCKWAPR